MLGFKITQKIAPQASHAVRQAIWGLLLDGYTGVRIDRDLSLVFMRGAEGQRGIVAHNEADLKSLFNALYVHFRSRPYAGILWHTTGKNNKPNMS